jgi:transcriptional regulator with XRE-family HTH domain
MPLTLPAPPELGPDFWDQPEILTAVEHEHLGAFLLAYRGARRARFSQDQVARWLGRPQSWVSLVESGQAPVTEHVIYKVSDALHVPASVATHWGVMTERTADV